MSKRILLNVIAPVLLVTISGLVAQPSHAAARRFTLWKRSMRYEAAFNVPGVAQGNFSQPDPTCDARGKNCRLAAGDGKIDIGGMTFDAIGGRGKLNVVVTVKDDNNLFVQVPITACQDLNGNKLCDPGEPDVRRCLPRGKNMILVAVRNKPIVIFVSAFDGCPDITNVANSQGGATSGTVTLSALIPR